MNKVITEQSDWDELLELITDRSITPVLGKEMYKFRQNGSVLPVDAWLSKQLLEKNQITDQSAAALNDAVNYLENEKKQETMDVIRKLKSIVKEINFDFPLLSELLQIKDLNYYINTAVYNSVLEKKIQEVRGQQAGSVNFSITEPFADSTDMEKLNEPFVFNVFGSLYNTVDPALSDEDLLEYTGFFKEKISNAVNIKNALSNKTLLFLGCTFPDWMTRIMMRLLSHQPMHDWGTKRKIIIVNDDTEFRKKQYETLKNYKVITYEGNTADFVKELVQQWKKRNPETVKNKIVFLSYTREDIEAVENLKKAIEQINNVTCWYDKREIAAGDDWTVQIAINIRGADLFIPLISTNSLDHEDGYVQKEWFLANNVWIFRKNDGNTGKYIVPIVIDDSNLYGEKISRHFDNKINIVKIPKGNPNSEFLNQIKEILNLA